MGTRDLARLAPRVKAHRLELYPSRLAAAEAAGISKDTWRRVEEGMDVREVTYAKVDRALGWATGSCVAVAEGAEPVLVGSAAGDESASAGAGLSADAVREAAFKAARQTLPNVAIGDLDAFSEQLVEALRRSGDVSE
ncbi:hypothetical protein [Streptomyces sp. H27-C3]|uniref:hypothetical protein n=1 Tax=Streptomyces sp. H27-C3 TaxID=3046305 RepID=UPI0024BA4D06|nr:hypothetical protein [Streptomyces sp. H27-C3]MDJ0460300.1 hypothetical protein [Streptomyces sp. H27-C3]